MSNIAIKAENLSKQYSLGKTKIDSIYGSIGNLFSSKKDENSFWALQNLDFEIQYGSAVGIIGRNGAGKSTLLKVLSRITQPTRGRFTIEGRVSSLLEVGTGFHPELSGRENIFLNGTILGMSRSEIKSKLDEIVSFSGVEKFLDTPVKHYSSGMYVRLAFAVAAHLEPEILIIDEVLAVGDAQFQKKCLGKMKEVTGEGRTVLFVSHNMQAVEQLCTSGILLDHGSLKMQSNDVRNVIKNYYNDSTIESNKSEWIDDNQTLDNDIHSIKKMGLYDSADNAIVEHVRNDEQIHFKIYGRLKDNSPIWNMGFVLSDENNQIVYISRFKDESEELWPVMKLDDFCLKVQLPNHFLNEGNYRIELFSELRFKEYLIKPGENAPSITFSIKNGLSKSPYWLEKREGICAPILKWENSL